jgi:anthranilate phosphoribosyltransferase
LEGKEQGPKRQAVCLNAGAALYVAGKAATLAEGAKLAEALIDEGAALRKLEEFIEETNRDEELIA